MVSGNGVRLIVGVLLAYLLGGTAAAEAISAESFHTRVQSLYSFSPQTLDEVSLPAKSKQLDEFWSYVKSNRVEALPRLRGELSNTENSKFFFYDGAKLLLSLSKDKSDQALALRSLPRVDFRDIQLDDYLRTVHWFARNGFDTREAAFRVLDFPDFEAFIPQHVLTLGQNYAFIYMIFSATPTAYLNDLIERLKTEPDPRSQKSLLLALWYTVTPEGVSAIQSFGAKPETPKDLATYAYALLARRAGTGVVSDAATVLREDRMMVMRRPISDESLHEFDRLTQQLLGKQ